MPELPEVETVRAGLQALLPGKIIAAESHDWPKSFPNSNADVAAFLIGSKIVQVRRRAKVLLIDLSSNYTLVTHLKMTGQLVFVSKTVEDSKLPNSNSHIPYSNDEVRFGAGHPNDSLIGQLPDKSTRVTLTFKDNSQLFFNDQRKFGWMKVYPTPEVPNIDFMVKVGPEPLEEAFTPQILFDRLQRRKNTSIKAALLDQTVLAGVGNIYADESLWGAKIHPATLVKHITAEQVALLHKELQFVLNLAIEQGGSSNHTYVNAEGKKGSYMHFARVFRREGQACPRCGAIIEKSKVAGRGTHTCPACQNQR
jgi:formamidopyrimidine-DNA glycosylase